MQKKIHFNKPQLKSAVIDAPTEYAVMGRGTGKTVGILARKSAYRYFDTMPRGTGVILNATYTQAFTRTLKELVRGWQMLGYQHEHHYVIGKRPNEKWKKMWNWKGPYAPPFDFKYMVSWYNGACGQIVSQDRPGSSNGLSIDWIIGDELKLINREKFQTELLPANRGIVPAFSNNPYHHGMTFTTDMPVGTAGRWILEMVNKMDREVVNEIWRIQTARFKLTHLLKKETRKVFQEEIKKQINVLDEELNDLRKGLLYYHEASTLDNIHALGVEYIKEQLRTSTQFQFDTQILNLRPLKLEDGFYPDFDEEIHGYFAENEGYFDNLEYDPFSTSLDCRKDKDLNINTPLHMAGDYNRRIHPFVFGQPQGNELRILKGIHSLYPGKLKEALELAVAYYKPHKKKLLYYWYDHTAVGDQHETRICDDVIAYFRKNHWIVKEMYINQQPGHEDRYRMWGDLLTESGKYKYRYRINRENCDKLILSKCQAEAEQRKDGFGKNKKPEQDANFPADEATHYTDAEDTLVFGILESGLEFGNDIKAGGGMTLK